VAVISVIIVLVFFLVPISHPISGTVKAYCCVGFTDPGIWGGFVSVSFPNHAAVTINWQSTNISPVDFWLYTDTQSPVFAYGMGNLVCDENGGSGICRFISDGQPCGINVVDEGNMTKIGVTYSGSYSAPLL
jgi:hypothetical protein